MSEGEAPPRWNGRSLSGTPGTSSRARAGGLRPFCACPLARLPTPKVPSVMPAAQPLPAHVSLPTPAVGRIVHYVSRGSADGVYRKECRAATITEVLELEPDGFFQPGDVPRVGLAVFNPTGLFFQPLAEGGVAYHGGAPLDVGETHLCTGLDHAPGTFHWPARI